MMDIRSLQINNSHGDAVPNRLFAHSKPRGMALVLPGIRYTCDMPLLYYLTQALLEREIDVLQLHTDYNTEAVRALAPAERLQRMIEDAQAALETASQDLGYAKLILAGKSIGSLAMAMMISAGWASEAACIWLTPLLRYPFVVDAALLHPGPALFIASRTDDTFEAESMAEIQRQTDAQVILFDQADHSLLIPGELPRSLEIMEKVIQAYITFLDGLPL